MTDFERKVYRIIFEYDPLWKNPSIEQLKRKTRKERRGYSRSCEMFIDKR